MIGELLKSKCAARVQFVSDLDVVVEAQFWFPDPEAQRRFFRMLDIACKEGYSVEMGLIQYDGEPDAVKGRAARKKGKGDVERV